MRNYATLGLTHYVTICAIYILAFNRAVTDFNVNMED